MAFSFTDDDIKTITKVLQTKPERLENAWSWHMENKHTRQSLVFTIYADVDLGKGRNGALISAQTHHGYYELHECHGYMVFEPDEIIFVNASKDRVSSLIIGKQCTCSMYSNISRDILSADFAALDPSVLLSAMQLSITEEILK